MRCADLWSIGFAISLPPHSFCYRGHSLLIALLIMMSAGVAPVDVQQAILNDFVPTIAEIHGEIAAYRGTWSDVQNARLIEALDIQFAGIPFFLFWRAGGLILIGMALFKLGVFSATRSVKFYIRFLGVSGIIGFPLVAHRAVQLIGQNWDPSFSLLQHGGVYIYRAVLALRCFMWGASC